MKYVLIIIPGLSFLVINNLFIKRFLDAGSLYFS